MLSEKELRKLYVEKRKSVAEIARILRCSESKVNYWMKKFGIQKRSIADAAYTKRNPSGDPFVVTPPATFNEALLHGMGIGLYWGEGTKANKYTIRLGNTDPDLVCVFIKFLEQAYKIDRQKLRFGLQVFSDMNPAEAQRFWQKRLGVSAQQFQKVIITPSRGAGSYRKKTRYGVLTVHYNNKKLRDILNDEIEKWRKMQ